MCGIAGKILFGRDALVSREAVVAMTSALAHRGPDDSGYHFAPNVGLGHRRLGRVRSRAERQPFANLGETAWIALDGEIHNAAALRWELERHRRVFRTTSDAEVVVQGYGEWGDQVVARLRGAFAFALWDGRLERLLIGRDRLGVRPLHYAVLDGRGLVFASEIKALLEDPEVPRDWDPAAVREYIALGYVPSPTTLFRRILKVPAGHLLTAQRGRIRVTQYWDLALLGEAAHPGAAPRAPKTRDHVERFDEVLRDAVGVQASDHGATVASMSGDVESAIVAGCLAERTPGQVITTEIAFDAAQAAKDASRARSLARHFGCQHHTDVVAPNVAALLPRLAWHFDEPLADAGIVTRYYEAAAARAHAPVALFAAGADEVWAGHDWHRLERIEALLRRPLGPLGFGVGLLARAVPLPFTAVRVARHLALPRADACARKHAWLHGAHRVYRLYTRDFARNAAGADPFAALRSVHEHCPSPDALDRALYVDIKTRLADQVLATLDRVSSAAGLQVRLPMLDYRLVEFGATVSSSFKLRGGTPKYLLRKALERRVPARLLQEQRRVEAPASAWLRGPLAPMMSDLLLSGRFRHRGIFDQKAVTRAWQAHLTGRRDHHRELWSLLMLELWFERFADAAPRVLRAA